MYQFFTDVFTCYFHLLPARWGRLRNNSLLQGGGFYGTPPSCKVGLRFVFSSSAFLLSPSIQIELTIVIKSTAAMQSRMPRVPFFLFACISLVFTCAYANRYLLMGSLFWQQLFPNNKDSGIRASYRVEVRI